MKKIKFDLSFLSILSDPFVALYKESKSLFSASKSVLLFLICSFFGLIGTTASSLTTSAFFPNNQSVTLHMIAEDFKNETGELPNGLVYSHQLISQYEYVSYRNIDVATEMRNLYYNNTFIDLYLSDWGNKYSPGVVDYLYQEDVSISFLMMPKSSYVYREWQYSLPLLYPEGNSPLPPLSSPNEIYINKNYADKLLHDKGLSTGDYRSLIDVNVVVPYLWNQIGSATQNATFVNVDYIIKGIIDPQSKEYSKYHDLFGDFFVVNEYFSLPLPSQTYFNILESSSSMKLFDLLLNKYKYQAQKNYFSSLSSSFNYQTRISFFDKYNGQYSIHSIDFNEHKYCQRTSACFEIFSSPIYVVYLALSLSIHCFFLFLLIISVVEIKKRMKNPMSMSLLSRTIWALFVSILGILIGLGCATLLHSYFGVLTSVSYSNYYGTIIYFVELSLVLLAFFWERKTENPIKSKREGRRRPKKLAEQKA